MENKNIKKTITWDRLSEIATNCLHALYEAEPYEAMEYFRDTLDLTDEEREYFGIPTETEDDTEFNCSMCPYHYCDEEDDYPTCHYNGDDGYAPCTYEEPEEVNYEELI